MINILNELDGARGTRMH